MTRKTIAEMSFANVYPLLVQKAERKGRTREEVNTIIFWLTGYDEASLAEQLEQESTYETFFTEAPALNPNRFLITGKICGVDVASIEDSIEQKLAVERICLLTGPNGSRRLIERFKRVLMEAWAGKFELDLRQEDVQAVASFMASGIVGLLGEQAGKPCDERFDRCLQIISKVFSASAIEFAHNKSKAGSE